MKKFKEESQKQSLDIKKILYKMKKGVFFLFMDIIEMCLFSINKQRIKRNNFFI
ncbi:hypothetical protein ES703_88634 [subsurface metagenome]